MAPGPTDTRVALVVVVQANCDNWERLTSLPKAVKDLTGTLTARYYELKLPKLVDGGTRDAVIKPLGAWLKTLTKHSRLVLYWTGHGTTPQKVHYLVTKDSSKPATPDSAVPTRDLGLLVAASQAEKV